MLFVLLPQSASQTAPSKMERKDFDKLGVVGLFYVTPHPPQAVPLPLKGKAKSRLLLEEKLSAKLTDEV